MRTSVWGTNKQNRNNVSTHSRRNFNISSSAAVEILGQNTKGKQQDDRESYQFTVISEIENKIIK